jgi:hypothetical protein
MGSEDHSRAVFGGNHVLSNHCPKRLIGVPEKRLKSDGAVLLYAG